MKIDKFNVLIIRKGDAYGLNSCLTHDEDEPLVEFYDARYPHTEHGQFVSRYYLKTLLKNDECGISLDCGRPDMSLDSRDMKVVRVWLAAQV